MQRVIPVIIFCIATLALPAQNLVDLQLVSSYSTGIFDEGATEILAHDPSTQTVYSTNGEDEVIDMFDVSNPLNIVKIDSIELGTWGDQANSVDFANGHLAAAVEADDFDAKGKAVFFDANGNYVTDVEVGVLPDMITFSPDGNTVLVANEGEPDDEYSKDPYGSVSIIDVSGGIANLTQSDVTTLDFSSFNNNYDPAIRNFGPVVDFTDSLEDTNLELGNFYIYDASGSATWDYDNFGGDNFAEANAFSSDTFSVDWMILPGMNLTGLDSAYFSFWNARNFSGDTLEILISTDYDTTMAPSMASWDTITANFQFSQGSYNDVFSGEYSLHNYLEDNVSIAFYYQGGPGAGNSALYQIDDVRLRGTHPELARNLEPEYIAVSPDNTTAFVVCQENNAMAVVDLSNKTISSLGALGFKDWSDPKNKMDASNKSSSVDFKNWPVFGMYQPDAIKAFEDNGKNYIITANEGDARDYDFYSEEERVEDLILDPSAFPNAANLQMEDSLGRLKITTSLGDNDGDGDYDELYSYGARSFSIWDDQLNLVFDSEDMIATEVFSAYPNNFNSNNDDNNSFKSRSDDKGTEPEAVEVAMINGYRIAFVGLERMGGVMVFDITDPSAPTFVSYFLNRDFSVAADDPNAGDIAPEDIRYVPASESPSGTDIILVSNEVSGTFSIYEITGTIGLDEQSRENSLQAYPNPVEDMVRFTKEIENGTLYDLNGKKVMRIEGEEADLSALVPGIYTLQTGETSLQLLVK